MQVNLIRMFRLADLRRRELHGAGEIQAAEAKKKGGLQTNRSAACAAA